MIYTEVADTAPLFIGSTHIAVENMESSEMAREWMRQQEAEAAARMAVAPRQIVDLPPRFGQIVPGTPTTLSA